MTARSERPINREISWVRPPMRPFTDSRSERVLVAAGSIAYSAVTQPRPEPLRQRGTPSEAEAAQSTRVPPNAMTTDPAAWSSQLRVMVIGRSSSSARPSARGAGVGAAVMGTTLDVAEPGPVTPVCHRTRLEAPSPAGPSTRARPHAAQLPPRGWWDHRAGRAPGSASALGPCPCDQSRRSASYPERRGPTTRRPAGADVGLARVALRLVPGVLGRRLADRGSGGVARAPPALRGRAGPRRRGVRAGALPPPGAQAGGPGDRCDECVLRDRRRTGDPRGGVRRDPSTLA